MKTPYRLPLDKNVFDNKLFKPQVNILRYLGYIVRKNDKYQRFQYWICVVFHTSIAISCSLGCYKVFVDPKFSGGNAMSAATTFLYLSLFIAMRAAFLQRNRLARMLQFLQNDIEKFLMRSDEIEEKLFEEMHRYMKVITYIVSAPTSAGVFLAILDGVYRLAVGSYWYPEIEGEMNIHIQEVSYTPPLLIRLFPFDSIAKNIFFGFVLPLYSIFVGGLSICLWHTFTTSLMTYVNLKWKLMQKRISEMDFGKLYVSRGQEGNSALSPATAFLYLTTSIAIHNAFFRRKRIARMLNYLQKDLDKLKLKSDEIEEEYFREAHRYMNMITYCIWTPSLIAGFMAYLEAFYMMIFAPDEFFNLDNIKNSTDTQPLLTRLFPFREVNDDWFVGYILPLYALFLGIMAIPLWHTFIAGMMSYVILKWRIMYKRLSTMDVSKVIMEPYEKIHYASLEGSDSKLNFLRERMCKFSVVEQIRIRWFACELQELIGVPVFADFIIFSILICFLFYEIVTENPTKMDFVFMCLYLFVMSSILWVYHWHATLMKENSIEMGFAIYSCDWYNYPLKIQKLIQIAMIITARPLEIKAVLVPLSLTTFIDIIRAAYSYFSLLRNTSN